MANMTFKANLIPSSDLGYTLGASNQRWSLPGARMTANLNIGSSSTTNGGAKISWYGMNTAGDATREVWMGYANGANAWYFWDNTNSSAIMRSTADGTNTFYGSSSLNVLKAGDTMTGSLIVSKATEPELKAQDTTNNNLRVSILVGSGHINHGLYSYGYAPTASTFTSGGKWIIYRGSDGEAHSGMKLYSAVWNDYAEYRITKNIIEPGRCIREIGDDTLTLTTERLQKGCEIVSDTFGFAIGQTLKAKTPTAVSGRVLAYLYEDKEIAKQHIGDPVCSGPDGTVSIMTEEEEVKYPSRIIGTISSIPDYDIWYGGTEEDPTPIKVNGRIWIRVR